MAPISDRAIPAEDTFNMLRDRAAKDGDAFGVKVMRRAFNGGMPELIASLSAATVEHLVNPEQWIPSLCGGGNISMQGYHSTDLSKPVGGFLQVKISQEAKEVDPSVVGKTDWRGPGVIDFPRKESPREREQLAMYDIKSPPGPGEGMRSATSNNQTWTRQPGGDLHREQYGGEGTWQERQRLQGAMELEKRKLEEERLANERQKHRDELESIKKAHDADMRALKLEMMGAIQQQRPPDTGMADLMKAQIEDRRLAATQAAEDRREREKMAAEDRREAAARQERNDERFNRLLEKMSERPKEDPLAMIEKVSNLMGKNNNAEAQMKMMASMAEMHSMQIGTAMDFIQASADLNLGGQQEKESPIIKGIEAAMKGLGSLAKGAQVRRPAQQFAQPAVPPTYEQQARAQVAAGQQVAPQPPRPPAPPQPPLPSVIQQLENGIRGMQPVELVAKAIVNNIKEESVAAALLEVAMDFEVLINNRLGVWMKEHVDNEAYVKTLMVEVEKELRLAGYLPPLEEEGQVVEEEGSDEGEENEE